MGKAFAGLPEAAALNTREEDGPFRVGAYLALQRKLRGIDLDELEGITHIPRRSLERLESGAFDGDPDGFVRGFVRTVSAAIGLDADETVSRMLDEPRDEGVRRGLSAGRGIALAIVLGGALVAIALVPGVVRRGTAGPASPALPREPATASASDAPAAAVSLPSGRPGAIPRSESSSPVRRDALRDLATSQPRPAPEVPSERVDPAPPMLPAISEHPAAPPAISEHSAVPPAGPLASPHGGDPHRSPAAPRR